MAGIKRRGGRATRTLGQGMTEYIIIVALIAIAAIGVVTLFGDNIRSLFASSEPARAETRDERRDERREERRVEERVKRDERRPGRSGERDDRRSGRTAETRDARGDSPDR